MEKPSTPDMINDTPEDTPHFLELAQELTSARPNQGLFALQQITDVYKKAPAELLKDLTPEGNKALLDEVVQFSDPQEFVDLRPKTTK